MSGRSFVLRLMGQAVAMVAKHRAGLVRGFAVMATATTLMACTTTAERDARGIPVQPVELSDPLEPVNRVVFDINLFLDGLFIKPIAGMYRALVPPPIREVVYNVTSNAAAPLVFVNDVLQGEPERASDTLGRFMLNTIAGLGGIIDVAGKEGLERHDEDFGQTLATYGADEGIYLVLPLIGPATARHTVGRVGDYVMDPLRYVLDDGVRWGLKGTELIDRRSRRIETLDEMRRTSIDFYAAVRSAYWQQRINEIHQGTPPPRETDSDIFRLDFDDADR